MFGVANQNTSYSINGRNEIVSAGGTSFSYDNNRNVTNDGTRAYAYDAANQLTSAGSTSFSYDPSGALYDVGAYRLATVGGERLALYTTSGGALHRRIVPGAGLDEAAAYYHGAGTTTRRWPLADQLGSVIAYANASGTAANINTYDEYGRPGSGNAEFLQYTGQLAVASAPGVYNYRNRFYQADVGRFLQTDPIGYGAGLNLYAHVGNDPINRIDPWGLDDEIVVEGRRPRLPPPIISLPNVLIDDVGTTVTDADGEIVVVALRRTTQRWSDFQSVANLYDVIQQFGCAFGPETSASGYERGFLYGRYAGEGALIRTPVITATDVGGINMIPMAQQLQRRGFVVQGGVHSHPYPGAWFWVPARNAYGTSACDTFCFSDGDINTARSGVLGAQSHVAYTDRRLTITQREAQAGQPGYMTEPWLCPAGS